MANLDAVTTDDFQTKVLEAEGPVLVDFWADWCGPSRQIAPILEEIAAENEGKLTILKLDADANPELTASQRVVGLPTMKLYVGGEEVKSITGAKPKSAILKEIEEFVS